MKHYVYRFLCNREIMSILYAGETCSMDRRMSEHFSTRGDNVSPECYKTVNRIEYIEFDNSVDAKMFEIYYINIIKPPFNIRDKQSDFPMLHPEYDCLIDKWQLYEEGEVQAIIQRKIQDEKERTEKLIEEFDKENMRLTKFTDIMGIKSNKKMKDMIDSIPHFREQHIYGCPYNSSQYITITGQIILQKEMA